MSIPKFKVGDIVAIVVEPIFDDVYMIDVEGYDAFEVLDYGQVDNLYTYDLVSYDCVRKWIPDVLESNLEFHEIYNSKLGKLL